MTLTIENRPLTICQVTQHGLLIPWGRFARYLKLSQRLRAAVPPRHHQDALSGGDLILEFGLASLSGCEYLEDLNLGAHPLAKDQAVQDAWDVEFRHYTTVSRFLYGLDDADVERVQAALEAVIRPYIRSATHEALCYQEYLTGRPVSAYSTTYPPDTVFGYMANRLYRGHQGDQLQAIRPQLAELEARYTGKRVRPTSQLAQARKHKTGWERQLRSVLEQERQARRALEQHQQRLAALIAARDALLNWLAQLEVDNATCPNPVRIRWLLDGGFGDAANVTSLIEMGYDVYTMAHNGKTTQVLLKDLPEGASWTQVGARTQALDTERHELGDCPYPVRLTLLRWLVGDQFRYSTLISFSDAEELPTADLFPTCHERQDVEAGIKQGKGTFGFTKLHVRSPAGIRLLGQFALVFWPNFVHWAADWLAAQAQDRFAQVLQQVRKSALPPIPWRSC